VKSIRPATGQGTFRRESTVPSWNRPFPEKKASSHFGTVYFQQRMHRPVMGQYIFKLECIVPKRDKYSSRSSEVSSRRGTICAEVMTSLLFIWIYCGNSTLYRL